MTPLDFSRIEWGGLLATPLYAQRETALLATRRRTSSSTPSSLPPPSSWIRLSARPPRQRRTGQSRRAMTPGVYSAYWGNVINEPLAIKTFLFSLCTRTCNFSSVLHAKDDSCVNSVKSLHERRKREREREILFSRGRSGTIIYYIFKWNF